MKFFIASPWRNKAAVKELEDALILRGHAPWSFLDDGANLATGEGVMEEFKQFGQSVTNWKSDSMIGHIFASEMRNLKDCDVLILLEPAGRSSLTEAGIAYGMGKRIVLIGSVEHPEVVYLICERSYPNVAAFLKDIYPCPPYPQKNLAVSRCDLRKMRSDFHFAEKRALIQKIRNCPFLNEGSFADLLRSAKKMIVHNTRTGGAGQSVMSK